MLCGVSVASVALAAPLRLHIGPARGGGAEGEAAAGREELRVEDEMQVAVHGTSSNPFASPPISYQDYHIITLIEWDAGPCFVPG